MILGPSPPFLGQWMTPSEQHNAKENWVEQQRLGPSTCEKGVSFWVEFSLVILAMSKRKYNLSSLLDEEIRI